MASSSEISRVKRGEAGVVTPARVSVR